MANNVFVELTSNGNDLKKTLNDVKASVAQVSKETQKYNTVASKMKRVNKSISGGLKNISADGYKTSKSIQSMSSAFGGLGRIIGEIGLAKFIADSINSALEMIEVANLFDVALGTIKDSAEEFITTFSEVSGLDSTSLRQNVATFALLARSMGLANDNAETLSINTAKLAVDLSSLTNVPIEQVMRDLKSGLIGQTETVYKYGLDLTEATLAQEALRLGITKSVRSMSQGEKMALRYSVMIRQSALAQGDFANTINSPANQLRILTERIQTLVRTIGTVFIPILSAVLPYLNAFIILLTEAFAKLASLFGYEGVDRKDVVNGFNAIEESATSAGEAIKNATFGLDELNIISQESGSAEDAAIGGFDIDLEGYDNLMDSIDDKAQDIADKFRNIFNFVLSLIGGIALVNAGLKGWKTITDIFSGLSGAGTILGSIGTLIYDNLIFPVEYFLATVLKVPEVTGAAFNLAVAAVLLAIALLVAGIINQWDVIVQIFNQTVEDIKKFFQNLWDSITMIFDGIFNTIVGILMLIVGIFEGDIETIKQAWVVLGDGIQKIFYGVQNVLATIGFFIASLFVDVANFIGATLTGVVNVVIKLINSRFDWINGKLADLDTALKAIGFDGIDFRLSEIQELTFNPITIDRDDFELFDDTILSNDTAEVTDLQPMGRTVFGNTDLDQQIAAAVANGVSSGISNAPTTFSANLYLDGKQLAAAMDKSAQERGYNISKSAEVIR